MSRFVWGLVLALAILHYDFWYWDDRTLVFGFMPIGLAYHAGFSLVAGLVWFLAVRFAWPSDLEAWADELEESAAADAGLAEPIAGDSNG